MLAPYSEDDMQSKSCTLPQFGKQRVPQSRTQAQRGLLRSVREPSAAPTTGQDEPHQAEPKQPQGCRRAPSRPHRHFGLMFWFIRKKLVGSYFFLSATNRVNAVP